MRRLVYNTIMLNDSILGMLFRGLRWLFARLTSPLRVFVCFVRRIVYRVSVRIKFSVSIRVDVSCDVSTSVSSDID